MSNGSFRVELETQSDDVTGSCTLVKLRLPDGSIQQILVDCGSFIEKENRSKNKVFPFKAGEIDACVITHAHVDHIGRLPLLVKEGYRGKIYVSNVTANIIPISLEDNFYIMCRDYQKNKKNGNDEKLYEEIHVRQVNNRLQRVKFNTRIQLTPNIEAVFLENGHIFGASMIYIRCFYNSHKDINILFSGDYKKNNRFFKIDKNLPYKLNRKRMNIVCESTYGASMKDSVENVFFNVVSDAINKGHKILLPAFSLGRTQEVLLELRIMQEQGHIPKDYSIYCDSLLGSKYNKLAREGKLGIKKNKLFYPRNIKVVGKNCELKLQEERASIIKSDSPAIIVSSSGNGSYGPSNTYLRGLIGQEKGTVLFTGYCTEGTLGRSLIDAKEGEEIKFCSETIVKKATVLNTSEFSAHAHAEELLEFINQFEDVASVVVTHGNNHAKKSFIELLEEELKISEGKINIFEPNSVTRVDAWGLIKN